MKLSLWIWIILFAVWAVSGFAGVSFLLQAYHKDSKKVVKGWRRYLQAVRFRFFFMIGFLLVVWVIVSVFWVIANYRL